MVQGIAAIGANPQQAQSMPPEAQIALGKGFSSLTSEEIKGLQELSDDLKELSPDKLKVLEQVITFLKKNSSNYEKAVQVLVSKGIVEPGDLPPEYIPSFFEILDNMVNQAMTEGPQKKFARGGIAQLRKKAADVANAGTGGDKVLAHINPKEAAMLQATRGGGTNPNTGLPEYGFFDDIGNFLKQSASVVLPVALGFMGVPPILAGAVGSGVGAMINGASPGQALQSAAIGGLGGALFSGVSGMMSGQGFMSGVQSGFSPAAQGPLSDTFGGYQTPHVQPNTATPTQTYGGNTGIPTVQAAPAEAFNAKPGMMAGVTDWMSKNPLTTAGIAGLGGAALGYAMAPQGSSTPPSMPSGPSAQQIADARFPAGTFQNRIAPKVNVVPTYSPAYPNYQQGIYAATGGQIDARIGGHLEGPGTGTSDSIPAKLSDGEFVMTAKAVRGAGDGNRGKGAKKIYQLMHQFEKRA